MLPRNRFNHVSQPPHALTPFAPLQGHHLLCHDDVIGTRRVSWIIYLTDPEDAWTAEDGGALELYPLETEGVRGIPTATPTRNILPQWNQMVVFTVQPGISFHAVQVRAFPLCG